MKQDVMNDCRVLKVGVLRGHPLNRTFRRDTVEWGEFVESIRRRGVEAPLLVRELDGDEAGVFEVLAGHRRRAGAMEAGVDEVLCVVRRMTDEDALKLVVLENLQREEMTVVDEGNGVRALLGLGMTEEEVAREISRGLEWVRTRQGLLDLPEEVLTGLCRRRDEAGHVCLGTVEVLLGVPLEWREEAVQLVMHPVLECEPLGPRQAAEVVRECVVVPRERERGWDGALEEAVGTWQRRLHKEVVRCLRKEGMFVAGVRWGERGQFERGMVGALVAVPVAEVAEGAPEGIRWLDLAVRHGMAVRVVPVMGLGGEVTAEAMVPEALLRQAEEAWREGSAGAWLVGKRRRTGVEDVTDPADGTDLKDERVEAALAACDGVGGEVPEDRAQVVIEQRMEMSAWVDLGPVRELRANYEAGGEWKPEWARMMDEGGMSHLIPDVCDWVLGLKK
jgi:ParB/RepB/Spo0J family partition protein